MANIYDMTDTWSNAGITYSAIKMDVSNAGSSSASKLLDLQVNGQQKFMVDLSGVPYTYTTSSSNPDASISYGIREHGASGDDRRLNIALRDGSGPTAREVYYRGIFSSLAYAGDSYHRFIISGSEVARLTSTGLGIGTTSPATALDVNGQLSSATAGTATIGYTFGGQATKTGMGCPADGTLSFYAGTSTERMRIDSSGNVGIGTSSPDSSYKLHVAGNLLSTGNLRVEGTQIRVVGSSSAASPSIQPGNDADTGIFHPSSNTLGFSTFGSERMRIDNSGNLLVGKTSTSYTTAGTIIEPAGRYVASYDGGIAGVFARLTSDGDIIQFRKDGTTVGSIGSVAGSIYFAGPSGANFGIKPYSAGIAPVNNTGALLDGTADLGASSARFDDIYATNGTIQTSDANEKQDIDVLSEAEQRVAVACKGLLRKFRWKSAVAEKGDDARIHFGIIAQDLQAAFEAEGLDAGDYAMFIHSTWTDEETGEERSRMGVRYSELLAFIIAAI